MKVGKKVQPADLCSELAKLGPPSALTLHQLGLMSSQPPESMLGTGDAVRDVMVAQAAQQAEQAQYLQQVQFWKQMKAQEVQEARAIHTERTAGPSRFREGYRPMWLCKFKESPGGCERGDKCTFAHALEELHVMSPVLPQTDGQEDTALLAEQGKVEPEEHPDLQMRKKRDLCTQFGLGECLLAAICPFAHGEQEIGIVSLAVSGNVKTRICPRWREGKCLYGKLCNSAHGAREIGLKRPFLEMTREHRKRRPDESFYAEKTPAEERARRRF